jgi:serine/threonine protein kinase
MTSLVGNILMNRYEVKAFVASGGMSDVFYVWDLSRNVHLAMKVLHMDLINDPTILKFFMREARALQKLRHPNIVPFYGIERTNDFMFLLEEFIDGQSLKQVVDKQRDSGKKYLSIEQTLVYTKAVQAALGYAHSMGVVHCDIKPGNVMIDRGGNIFLADFGIARHADSTETTVGVAGAPAYMAPEQIKGLAVTPETDIYALGIMVFELLTGQRPFTGSIEEKDRSGTTIAEQVRQAHLRVPPPNPSLINPSIPPLLSSVLLRALEKEPQNRYSSTTEFFSNICVAVSTSPELVPDRIENPNLEEPIYIPDTKKSRKIPLPLIVGISLFFIGCLVLAGISLKIAYPSLSNSFVQDNNENTFQNDESSKVNEDELSTELEKNNSVIGLPATTIVLPTATPQPSFTFSPVPTSTTLPTSTSYPTDTPYPTHTRVPTEKEAVEFQIQNATFGSLWVYVNGEYLGEIYSGQVVKSPAEDWGSVSLKVCNRGPGHGCSTNYYSIYPTNWLIVLN